jgi:polar amino acid transport system substrate-binding protein
MTPNTVKAIFAAASLFVGAFGITPALAQSTLDTVHAKGKIVVGTLIDYPPFGTIDANNQPDGLDEDVAKLFAKKLGVEIEFVPLTSANRIPYLMTQRVDAIIASLAITPERAAQVQFSNPYYVHDIVLVGLKELNIKSGDDLGGVSASVARATTTDVALTKLAAPGAIIQRFDDLAGATQALLSGQAQALATGRSSFLDIDRAAPGKYDIKFGFERNQIGIALRPGDQPFLDAANEFVAGALADGSLNELYKKWVGTELPPMTAPDYIKPKP